MLRDRCFLKTVSAFPFRHPRCAFFVCAEATRFLFAHGDCFAFAPSDTPAARRPEGAGLLVRSCRIEVR
jgi:hypothetical protein